MIPFDALLELFTIATESSDHGLASPTPRSVEHIQSELGIRLPQDYLRLARECPSYGSWLAGIGEEYDHRGHILTINQIHHFPEQHCPGELLAPLPKHFIVLNQGYDGYCACWDLREATETGEHRVVYVQVSEYEVRETTRRYESFRAYIEDFAVFAARGSGNRSKRRRAKRLIAELGLKIVTSQPKRYFGLKN